MSKPPGAKPAILAVVLFGSPGSGKGTQSKLLVEAHGIPQISTGDMLRTHVRHGNSVGNAVESKLKAGILVKDEVVNSLVEQRLAEADTVRGFILDGYPRTVAQAEKLCRILESRGMQELVIHLVVDYNVIIARLTGRRQCPVCGTLYNLIFKAPKVPGVCDLDGGKLIVREDDRESVIRERLEEYQQQTRPILDYFRAKGKRIHDVDASHDQPEVVFRKIETLIQEQ
jgi:adenylate kinase